MSVLMIETNGTKSDLIDWSHINWLHVGKIVKNLRRRIFRARKLGQWKQLRRLQKLLLKSYANLLLAIRQITQVNKGKKTAGVDKEVIDTPAAKVKLANKWEMPKALPTKRIYIPKANGKLRPLGIPTVKDRVAQAIMKNVLEPEWEALFEANSYGFRPGRGCHDAMKQCFNRLMGLKGRDKWVLDADIKGFFDNIAHETIQKMVDTIPRRDLIKSWLKSGFVYEGEFNPTTETGTPQGGVISPLLANIGLHGLEEFVGNIKLPNGNKDRGKKFYNPKVGIIRYADDFVITGQSKEVLEEIQELIKQWLSQRGLEISIEKTRIVHIDDGFNFLGFNLKHYGGKLLIKPQKEKVLKKCKEIGETIKKMATCTQIELIGKLNPILRGFANYYRVGVSKEIFSYINTRVWKYLWSWAKRKHPKKNKKWIKDKYFRRLKGKDWCFACLTEGRRGKKILVELYNIADTKIIRHVKVAGTNSPDDPSLKEYWSERATNMGKIRWAKGSKYERVAKNQNYKCPICGQPLINGEDLETHHIVPVKDGGTDDAENLIHLHKACHQQVHSNKTKSKA